MWEYIFRPTREERSCITNACFPFCSSSWLLPFRSAQRSQPSTRRKRLEGARQDLAAHPERTTARRGAAIVDTLSALPGSGRPRPSAVNAVQLLMFTNEYLMTDAERQALYSGSLDEKNSEMHRFMATLMRYMDDAGITQEESTNCARDLQGLTWCDHLPVRIGALFTMSSPYYFYDTGLARQARDQIAAEFPGTFLAQEAQRLPLYYARTHGAAGLKEAFERTDERGNARPDSTRRPRRDSHLRRSQKRNTRTGRRPASYRLHRPQRQGLAGVRRVEHRHGTARAPQVRVMAEEPSSRTRCVSRPRYHMSVARNRGHRHRPHDADALLNLDDIPWCPNATTTELKNSSTERRLPRERPNLTPPQPTRTIDARFNTTLAAKLAERWRPSPCNRVSHERKTNSATATIFAVMPSLPSPSRRDTYSVLNRLGDAIPYADVLR